MPSLDERREVAAKLRKTNLAEGAEDIQEIQRFDYVTAVRFVMWPNLVSVLFRGKPIVSMHEIIERLADLIEPEPERTCRMEPGKRGYPICSNCGEEMDAYTCEWSEPMEYSYPFCYACGARVKENIDTN